MAAQGISMGSLPHYVKAFGQPSSSADSQQTSDSPRVNTQGSVRHQGSPDVLCTEYGVGQFDGHSAWEQHGAVYQQGPHVQLDPGLTFRLFSSATPAVAAAAALTQGPEDPAAGKAVFKQLTSHMSPAELTELQHIIREQRLQRQQQDVFATMSAGTAAGPALGLPAGPVTPGLPPLNPSHHAGLLQQGLSPLDVLRVFGEAAAALTAALSQQQNGSYYPAQYSSYLAEMASQLVQPSVHCHQQQQQQQHYSPMISDTTGVSPAAAAAAATSQHPGVAPRRVLCSSTSRRPRTAVTLTLPWDDETTQLQSMFAAAEGTAADAMPEAVAAAVSPSSPAHLPCPPPIAASEVEDPSGCASSCSLKARFARLSADVQASVLSQLQDLESSEAERRVAKEARRAAREAAAANTQRKSSRARKVKTYDENDQLPATNNSRSVSPDPAAVAADRAGSTDANNNNHIMGSASPSSQQQQQQHEVIKKRVRFAFADDDDGSDSADHTAGKKRHGSSSSSSGSPQIQGFSDQDHGEALCALDGLTVFRLEAEAADAGYDQSAVTRVVRRVGPRAQARKRMHKKTTRRRRPQRAPLC